ncbi:hypothetical protein JMJ55_15495 [Belnapia sp. T6]|uniref:Uncharacterized protein n=1 Tax=Belnapia mucosa TaxID=2804532 RepID=A0ABS1V4X2_9PROT|nr:hypothetical protein [Belnapia mucosa]MBL6456740.1 hypothetical protein [Belnapia mucosa]
MRRILPSAAALGLAALLGGCGWANRASYQAVNGITNAGDAIGAPWGRMEATPPQESETVARLRGEQPRLATLQVEPGNVWPAQEGPRATLANPDAAMRNIPTYRPGELDRMSGPAGRSTWQPTDPPAPPTAPAGINSSSSMPPPALQPNDPPRFPVYPSPAGANAPPSPRNEGRVVQTPRGPVTSTGGTDRVQGYIAPNGSTGTLHNDGNTTTLIGPNGQVTTVPSPR